MNLKKKIFSFLNNLRNRSETLPESAIINDSGSLIRNRNPEPLFVMDNKLLSGKSALITGAGRNIGRSIALEMGRQGADIFFTDIDRDSCVKLEQELKEFQVRSKGFLSDISKTEDIDALHNFLVREKIVIDILVNNVGVRLDHDDYNDIRDIDPAIWQKTFAANVFGPMYLTKLISQLMVSNEIHGSILFITSIHESVPAGWTCYSSSKAALAMIVKELSLDVAPHRIRVNGIAPGYVSENEHGIPFDFKYAPLHKTSINPCYIGRAAVYLASDYFSRFTTGTVIRVDAGLSLYNFRIADNRSHNGI